jgi:hypothetical protein
VETDTSWDAHTQEGIGQCYKSIGGAGRRKSEVKDVQWQREVRWPILPGRRRVVGVFVEGAGLGELLLVFLPAVCRACGDNSTRPGLGPEKTCTGHPPHQQPGELQNGAEKDRF